MKENKVKFIISKTITFILIVGFIILFKSIFGAENTLIGVTTITGALLFLERNLTTNKLKYLFELIVLNVGFGLLAYIGVLNPVSALICNFGAMFFIGYIFSYDVRGNMFVPFGLQYVFMLAVPVDSSKLYERLLALVFGAIFIMFVQMIANKNKVEKEGIPALKMLFKLTRKILKEEKAEEVEKLREKFFNTALRIKETIYNSKKENFHIESNEKAILDIILFLSDIQGKKDSINGNVEYLEGLKEIEKYVGRDKEISFLAEIEYIDTNGDLKIICELLNRIKEIEKKNSKLEVPEEFKRFNIIKRYLNKNSMRFRYAFRLGISIGIVSALIIQFNLFQGKWILFTIFALIQPYSEYGQNRSKERVKGTLIGSLLALFIFTVAKGEMVQTVMIMGAGYIDCYSKNYKEKMICVTISAVGASLTLGGTGQMIFTRVILVIIGALISIFCNRFIFPYSIEDAKVELVNMYRVNGEKIIDEIKKGNKRGILENHYIIASLIEKKLGEFNQKNCIEKEKKIILKEYFNFKIQSKG